MVRFRLVRPMIATLMVAAIACTACVRAGPLRSPGGAAAGGDTVERHLALGGADRSYLLLDDGAAGKPAPLVIALHGGGGTGATMVPRWADKARAEGIVVAFPNGLGRMARVGTWNAGGCCGYAMSEGVDDVAFVRAVIDDVARTRPVDPSRIYVTGMSNGAMLTHRVAIALSDRIAGAAIVAGALFGDEAPPKSPVPVLIMHGVKDQVVGFDGGMSPMSFVARAQRKPFLPVTKAVDFWVKADGCATPPVSTPPGEVTFQRWSCPGGGEVVFYRLASATHMWPGASNTVSLLETTPYTAVNATDVVWDFFKRHQRALPNR